ncbi:hypothetical protein RFI_14507 [Reticulomyxa filosa]|uniref:Uncharacterized protein n=1 Tax=Reticulomyxa filosa TaxID=46433 RepID=X6N9E9_RETFI|nr:hypothetical protein RFI_14507 [Reticulomyxa filosa]|eukprot:ETO22686.1 hypothetical protein RFI_14507 [Reticulomyxa filosa]
MSLQKKYSPYYLIFLPLFGQQMCCRDLSPFFKKNYHNYFFSHFMMERNDIKVEETTSISIGSPFETLASLPSIFLHIECVVHNHEIIICGDDKEKSCYSYHTIKNQYKYICSYPKKINLFGHSVIKLVNKNNKKTNEITLLSFGGQKEGERKHIFIMKYISVWNDNNEENGILIRNSNHCNKWMILTDDDNIPINIGNDEDGYNGVRAIISGSDNNLLFITYFPNNISVFDLNTFQHIKCHTLPIDDSISSHCFVAKKENDLSIAQTDENKKIHTMMLFYADTGLVIEYDENNNIFQFHNVRVCTSIRQISAYTYVVINDSILFFGGEEYYHNIPSKNVYKYSMTENKWIKYKQTLPFMLSNCVAVLNGDNTYVHIIGRKDDSKTIHLKTKVSEWMNDKEGTKIDKQWMMEEKEKIEIEQIKTELDRMENELDLNKLKRKKEIEMTVEHWIRTLSIEVGWINDFNAIISRYIMFVFFFYFIRNNDYVGETKKKLKYFKPSRTLEGHSGFVNNAQFSPDGTKIASCSDDGTVRIWDIHMEKVIQVLEQHSHWINDAQFSPDGTMIVSGSDNTTIELCDVGSWTEIRKLVGHIGTVKRAKFAPDGKTIVSCSDDMTIRIWDVASGQELERIEGHMKAVNDVQFSSDGQKIVSASIDETIGIWDVKTGGRLNTLEGHAGSVTKVQFSPDGLSIVSCSWDRTIRIWDVMSGKEIKRLTGHSDEIKDVLFFPDGQTLASCSADHTIRLWDVKAELEIQKLEGHSNSVTGLAVSSDGNMILSSSWDTTVRIWGLELNRFCSLCNKHKIFSFLRASFISMSLDCVLTFVFNILAVCDLTSNGKKILPSYNFHNFCLNTQNNRVLYKKTDLEKVRINFECFGCINISRNQKQINSSYNF